VVHRLLRPAVRNLGSGHDGIQGAAMQQIEDWLEKRCLGQYARRFAENDIDFEILGDLTDEDLEKIGVTSLGHRRKLLRAIAELKDAGAPAPAELVAAASPAPYPPDAAERRQVTVLFSDLVGSTALSTRLNTVRRTGRIGSLRAYADNRPRAPSRTPIEVVLFVKAKCV
jgi:hypothetical protein